MSDHLLDTAVALVALRSPEQLPERVVEVLQRGPHCLSVLSYWEVVIKTASGKLDVGAPRLWWARAVNHLAARVLPVRPEHVAALHELPLVHKDPFDRMLIAQAIADEPTLVTTDRTFLTYASDRLRILL